MNRAEILSTAARAVTVDRAATHGDAERNFATIAAIWSTLTGATITAPQVALMLAGLKIARAWGNPQHGDSWVDLAGYAACGGEIATSTKTPSENMPFAAHFARRDAERAVAPASAPPDALGAVSGSHAYPGAEKASGKPKRGAR